MQGTRFKFVYEVVLAKYMLTSRDPMTAAEFASDSQVCGSAGTTSSTAMKRRWTHRKIVSLHSLLWIFVTLSSLSSRVGGLSNQECLRLFDTHEQGRYVCSSHPDLVPALEMAENIGRRECESSFKAERWNCSGFSILKAPNITNKVTKEAGYVLALSLAAIVHSVAKLCAQGAATSCTCVEEDLTLPQSDSTSYQMGCSDNVNFGVQFARNFLFKRHLGQGLEQTVEQHNMMIGSVVVHETMDRRPYICRCIGISGSCTVQTCQSELPEFSELGRRIRQIYDDHTCRVRWNGVLGENSRLRPDCDGDYTNRDIIYTDLSPRYCTRNLRDGSLGTLGRECDPHSSGPNSCDNLCTQCNHGHRAVTEETVENCYCEFVFCCDIRCHTCSKTRAYYVCT